jgi:hypothetical protein
MADTTPRPAAAPTALGDETLFDDVIGLLATLEQQRARAAERAADPLGRESLELVASMVNALVAFVTARCGDTAVLPSRVLARLAETDPYSQMLGEDNERITVATVEGLLASWSGPEADRQRMLDDTCRSLLDVLGTYGETVAALFRQARLRDEWRAMFAVFVDDLRAAAQQMAA